MFISVNGKAKEVTDIFAGGQDGKAHRITDAFGSVNGVARQIYTVEKEASPFDQFTWAEIKQLANEGKLLEHFNRFDKVTIKLKEPLRQTAYVSGYGNVELVQNEMMFQIAELTETKMRLMCPRASAIWGNSDIRTKTSYVHDSERDKWLKFALSYSEGGWAFNNAAHGWGLSPAYDRLKALDNAFPDDFRDVLSVVARPLISVGTSSITGGVLLTYDEDMRVTQISDDIFQKGGMDMSDPNCLYPIIKQSYYPTSVTDFTYYISLPPEIDTYSTRRNLVGNIFGKLAFFDHAAKRVEVQYRVYEYRVKRSTTNSPLASCGWSKGITTNAEYNAYNNCTGEIVNDYVVGDNTVAEALFPEVVIEKDAE